jgi:phosphoribosylanthranilate isomerase
MGKKLQLKVCGMREKENILDLCLQVHPDWMGMIFYEKSPRFVGSIANFPSLDIATPIVGVFVNAEIGDILQAIEDFQLSAIQLHGKENIAYLQALKSQSSISIFKAFSVGSHIDWSFVAEYEQMVDLFLFDTATPAYGGSGKSFDWKLLEEYPLHKPFLISGGIAEEHLEELENLSQQIPQLIGVDINSKFERSPGNKDIEKIVSFKKQLEKIYHS